MTEDLIYGNQPSDSERKLMDWFLYDRDLRRERVKHFELINQNAFVVDIEHVFFFHIGLGYNKPSLHVVPLKPSLQVHTFGALQFPLIQGSSHIAKVND